MKNLDKFNEVYSRIILEMTEGDDDPPMIGKDGNPAEGVEWKDLKKYPSEEYKYPCIFRREQGAYVCLFQFKLPEEVEKIQDMDQKIEVIEDISSKIGHAEGGDQIVLFLNKLERRAFTVIESDVKIYYLPGKEPWNNLKEKKKGNKYFRILSHHYVNSTSIQSATEVRADSLEEAIKIWEEKHPDWVRDGSRELSQPTDTIEAQEQHIEQLF